MERAYTKPKACLRLHDSQTANAQPCLVYINTEFAETLIARIHSFSTNANKNQPEDNSQRAQTNRVAPASKQETNRVAPSIRRRTTTTAMHARVRAPAGALALALALLLISSAVSGQPANKQTADNNPRLQKAYVALQALKRSITDDPKNLTANWCGPDVCAYFGVFCTTAPDDPHAQTVAGLDLNHGDLAGTFPEELGLLTDLALLHLNSNRFAGGLPESLPKLRLLHELDVSNNNLTGGFPQHILCLPNIKYVDLRFNGLCGPVPPALFDKKLDAIFLNDNHFDFELPESFGNSPASVVVLANLKLRGCIPESVGKMAGTLNELVVLNAGLRSCIPQEVGWLRELTVLDLSFNELQGMLPESMAGMHKLEQLDVAHNELWGHIPEGICALPSLRNFTYSYNYFCTEPQRCLDIRRVDDRQNCIAGRPDQRPADQCLAFLHRPPVHCDEHGCFAPPTHY